MLSLALVVLKNKIVALGSNPC